MRDANGVPQEDLKKTLLGLDDYFFLINDTNQELNQHFNPDYESVFDPDLFSECYNFKKEVLSDKFDYYFFKSSMYLSNFSAITANCVVKRV